MHLELTARPQFGNEVSNDAPKYLRLLDVDVADALKTASWRLIAWVVYQPRKQQASSGAVVLPMQQVL